MASRSAATAAASLTDEDLATLRAALAEGRTPTVYLREPIPTLDVPEGASAKVQSIDGRTLTVKPRRVDDELSYEAEELRMTRKAPTAPAKAAAKRAGAKKTAPTGGAVRKAAPVKAAPVKAAPTKGAPVKAAPVKAAPTKGGATKAPSEPAAGTAPKAGAGAGARGTAGAAQSPAGVERARKSAAAPQRRPRPRRGSDAVTVTIQGTASDAPHEWTVTVVGGGARSAKPVPVRAESVVQAVGALNVPAAAKAVDAVLESARAQAEQRVEELARELAEAKKTLRSLGK